MAPSSSPIRVLVADDHPLVRIGLASIINGEPDMSVVAEARDGQEAIELYRSHQPDVLLVDLRMPEASGFDAIVAIRKEFPRSRILVLTTYAADEEIMRALEAGAQGYLLKDADGEETLAAIRSVYAGRRHLSVAVGLRLAERFSGSGLTDRELEVLGLLARGGTNEDLASALGVRAGTVKWHVTHILEKLGASDRTMAVSIALQRGIIHLD
jgi:two-component system, NarL family, response regulator